MKKLIPRHSLIIAAGLFFEPAHFPVHEVLDTDAIARELVGDCRWRDIGNVAFDEVLRRAILKLSLGERVVVTSVSKREDRLTLARAATDVGVPVFYIMDSQNWDGRPPNDLRRGDGLAEVIDLAACSLDIVPRTKPTLDDLRDRWSGITFIGDVHGMQQSLLGALSWARSRNHYVVFLGDIIDYGPQTLEVADTVYSMVMRSEAELIIGNHERKIMRWLSRIDRASHGFSLSEGNKVTTAAIAALTPRAATQWAGRFMGLVSHASHVREFGDHIVAHASVNHRYWSGEASVKDIEKSALFGEYVSHRNSAVHVPRAYKWVDAIPKGRTVIVGHDIRCKTHPFRAENRHGGKAIFLDTGCGKGGILSSIDLRFLETGSRLEVPVRH